MATPYASTAISSVEDLLGEIGGMGKSQWVLVLILYTNLVPIGWSTQQMTFAGQSQEWYCATGVRINRTEGIPDRLLHACRVNNSYTQGRLAECGRIRYLDSAVTIVTEWNLVCDSSWVRQTVTSVEMAGCLLGVLLAGQSAASFGRKKPAYVMAAFHALMNFIAGFAMSWQMFAVCRFFIGLGIGGVLVLIFPYPMEFVPVKWRAFLAILPFTTIGISIFAGVASALENWSYLHLVCGLFAVPGLFGYLFVPESVRWLTVTGRLDQAERVYQKIAEANGTTPPTCTADLLQKIFQDEEEEFPICNHYSYLDLFTNRHRILKTVSYGLIWLTLAMAYHVTSDELQDLSTDRYLNIFVLAVVELPLLFTTVFASNILGRRLTAFFLFGAHTLVFMVCLIVSAAVDFASRGSILNGLCLTAKIFSGASWAVFQTWTAEVYPTVTRFPGYGTANAFGRLGFLMAPHVLDTSDNATATYAVVAVLCLLCLALTITLPETKGSDLEEYQKAQEANARSPNSRAGPYQLDPENEGPPGYQETNFQWTCQPNNSATGPSRQVVASPSCEDAQLSRGSQGQREVAKEDEEEEEEEKEEQGMRRPIEENEDEIDGRAENVARVSCQEEDDAVRDAGNIDEGEINLAMESDHSDQYDNSAVDNDVDIGVEESNIVETNENEGADEVVTAAEEENDDDNEEEYNGQKEYTAL